jgi:hypothetical protein
MKRPINAEGERDSKAVPDTGNTVPSPHGPQ